MNRAEEEAARDMTMALLAIAEALATIARKLEAIEANTRGLDR